LNAEKRKVLIREWRKEADVDVQEKIKMEENIDSNNGPNNNLIVWVRRGQK